MDYLFENLLDERFQEFCSVLINKKYENVQTFPVGQPDGGRDSISYINQNKEFIIFQVKYVRNPKNVKDPHKWLLDIMKEEIPKINKLIPSGASQYILITNVSGTAHLENGSIDKMNKLLSEQTTIPSFCWWRDDLCRIFEEDPLLKWNFPEIINGQDILNSVLFHLVNKDEERIRMIVNAYLADQYELDNEVKFKQIDLQNNTLDLFVDVPINAKKYNVKDKVLKETIEKCLGIERFYVNNDSFYIPDKSTNAKAAEFICNLQIQTNIQRILLEGGPGQGKSTISQYICQINRVKLLNKSEDLVKIPSKLLNTSVRFPIKIDLRHVAAWIRNKNPYDGILSEEKFKSINNSSLESFLQGNFIYHSKVDTITVEDILQIFKLSSILIVFDGFDEIADLKLRQDVIDFINKGLVRLNQNSKSLQVLITSRPSAFTENVDFPISLYPRFELTDLDSEVTNIYVEKWTTINKLDSKEKNFIKKLVDDKLKQDHIKELTKSPMQLAIFLNLIRTRGESLPNKRTALYDSYIELFFNREAEKNSLIRDKRDLIINIHEYLGWLLHSEAELLNTNGIIAIDDLKKKLENFLQSEGHDTNISDELFDVVKERVCALVSRNQGTFEFEVQPLREYFCAKFLYNTAPYATYADIEIKGTKPDRFRAILRNAYWQNVTRFYAGCFDKGELPMLIVELKELLTDKDFKGTSYAQLITSQLLSDWVFTQYPHLLQEVINIIINGISKGELINQDRHNIFSRPINIPYNCGRKELVSTAFQKLREFPKLDYANQLIGLLINNPENNYEKWLDIYSQLPLDKIEKWFLYGYKMGVLHNLDEHNLNAFFKNEKIANKDFIYKYLVNGKAINDKVLTSKWKEVLLQAILDRKLVINNIDNSNKKLSSLAFLSLIINSYFLKHILSFKNNVVLSEYILKQIDFREIDDSDKIDIKILQFKDDIKKFLDSSVKSLNEESSLWSHFLEVLIKHFGEQDNIRDLCISVILNLRLKALDENIDEDIFNLDKPLFFRFQTAKAKSGNINYWRGVLETSNDGWKRKYAIILFILLATPKTIGGLLNEYENILDSFDSTEFNLIINHAYLFSQLNKFPKKYEDEIEELDKTFGLSNRLKAMISIRYSEKRRFKFLSGMMVSDIDINLINSELLENLCSTLLDTNETKVLDEIKNRYEVISNSSDPLEYFRFYNKANASKLNYNIAIKIMEESSDFPQLLISMSENICFEEACKKMIPVGKIAQEENWF